MMRADKVVAEVAVQLPEKFPLIAEIRLFGSYAKGTNTARSDMDFLVLTIEPIVNRVLRSRIREEFDSIAARQRLETDVVFYSFDDYQNDASRFTQELHKSISVFRR